ncbi:MAG: hypothetical protein IT220_10660 [Flavobacteriaceae bacterium]|jgi:hypothetical protein|nr:hypothetical protein [Flavobacteriaceae bacterium]
MKTLNTNQIQTIIQKVSFRNISISKFLKLGILALVITVIQGCPPPPPPPCITTGTDFQGIYAATLASNSSYDNYTTMDLVTHEYTFTMLANKTVCQIGYQGNANLYASSIAYNIEIYDNTNSVMIYTGSHLFNSASTDYVVPSSSINLISGNSYTIRRIASNYLGNIGNTIGRIARYNGAPLPSATVLSGSFMQITSSNFYGTGGPVPNFGIPFIDIVFQ